VVCTIEIKLGGSNNLSKVSKVLLQSFSAASRILVSGETNKNMQLAHNMEMMTVAHYFSNALEGTSKNPPFLVDL